jgi:hypothetical protein
MLNIQKRYIVDENDKKLAVEIDYETFLKIEEILEDYALYQYIQETEDSDSLNLSEAEDYYRQLLKENGSQL